MRASSPRDELDRPEWPSYTGCIARLTAQSVLTDGLKSFRAIGKLTQGHEPVVMEQG